MQQHPRIQRRRAEIEAGRQREHILLAAIDLARARGVDQLTTRALADRLNITPEAIHHSYTSIDVLRLCIGAHVVDELSAELSALGPSAELPEHGLRLAHTYVTFAARNATIWRAMMQPTVQSEWPEWYKTKLVELALPFVQAMGAECAGRAIWSAIHGLAGAAVRRPEQGLSHDEVSSLVGPFIAGHLSRTAKRERSRAGNHVDAPRPQP